MSEHFKIKLSRKELTCLMEMYILFIDRWTSENEHEELLLEHAVYFYRVMEKQAANMPQNKFTFKLPAATASSK